MQFDLRRLGFLAALFGLGFVGWSMLHDDAALTGRAAELACRGHECNAVQKKKTRDAFGWTFTFMTHGEQTLAVDVTCTRAFWVFGDYRCDVSEIDHAADARWQY